jgi:hypothetical protein
MPKRAKRTYEPTMKLDMPFGEALERFAGTSPAEMHANITPLAPPAAVLGVRIAAAAKATRAA